MRIKGNARRISGQSMTLAAVCALTLLAAGCGGGGDDTPAPATGGTTPAPGGTTPAPAPGPGAAPALPPVVGDPAIGSTPLPVLAGVSVPTTLPCQVDEGAAAGRLVNIDFVVNRANATFSAGGAPAIAGAAKWTWVASREWAANQTTPLVSGQVDERNAKFDINNAATYYRAKLSNADGSRVSEIECFTGVTVRPR